MQEKKDKPENPSHVSRGGTQDSHKLENLEDNMSHQLRRMQSISYKIKQVQAGKDKSENPLKQVQAGKDKPDNPLRRIQTSEDKPENPSHISRGGTQDSHEPENLKDKISYQNEMDKRSKARMDYPYLPSKNKLFNWDRPPPVGDPILLEGLIIFLLVFGVIIYICIISH